MENGVVAGGQPSLYHAAEENVPFEWVHWMVSVLVGIYYGHMLSVPRTIAR